MFDEYENNLKQVFKYFSKKGKAPYSLKEDVTLEVQECINLFQKSKILDGTQVTTEDFIKIVERYYTPGTRLEDKLDENNFTELLASNPLMLPVNQEIKARNERMEERQRRIDDLEKRRAQAAAEAEEGQEPAVIEDEDIPEEEAEIEEAVRKEREETERVDVYAQWRKDTISKHLIYIKGVEIVFFEFKEIILALAVKLREQVDNKTGKLKVVLTTFIEDWLLRRLTSFVKFSIPTSKSKADASRQWPMSKKDMEIEELTADARKAAEDEKRREAEAAQQ